MKHIHLLFVALVIISFVWRVYLVEKKPEMLSEKWLKILPHALATGLLLSGVSLVFQGNWLSSSYGWIMAKLILMVVFIGLGLFTMREQGQRRWMAFGGAILCFILIVKIAFAKQILFFL